MDESDQTEPLRTLLSLIGIWRGEGSAKYPTMTPVRFVEEVRFSRRSARSLDYHQVARDVGADTMLHSEVGIWRVTGTGAIEVSVALPGAAEVSEGTLDGGTIRLSSGSVGRAATGAGLVHVDRTYEIGAGTIAYDVTMAASSVPLTHHISGRLWRVEADVDPR